MKKQKRTKVKDLRVPNSLAVKFAQGKWQILCDDCYREQYCQFAILDRQCILFRPKEK